jgi:hypothetical protein
MLFGYEQHTPLEIIATGTGKIQRNGLFSYSEKELSFCMKLWRFRFFLFLAAVGVLWVVCANAIPGYQVSNNAKKVITEFNVCREVKK